MLRFKFKQKKFAAGLLRTSISDKEGLPGTSAKVCAWQSNSRSQWFSGGIPRPAHIKVGGAVAQYGAKPMENHGRKPQLAIKGSGYQILDLNTAF